MSVPGSNLLVEALGLIASQPVQYYQNTGRTTTGAGRYVSTLAAPVAVTVGSVQAVPRSRFEILGLDMSKKYVTWFVPRAVVGIVRDAAGDQITYNGQTFQVETTTDWEGQDGWMAALCVQIGGANA